MTPAQRQRERELLRKRRARMTEAEKEKVRKRAREAMRRKRADPAKREAINAQGRKHYHAKKFDQNFTLPEVMICVTPGCDRLAVHDQHGQTGLCPDHLAGSHHATQNTGRAAGPAYAAHCELPASQ